MTRDETLTLLTGLFEKRLHESLIRFTIPQLAFSLASDAVDSLGDTLKLDPQYADAAAKVVRPPIKSMM